MPASIDKEIVFFRIAFPKHLSSQLVSARALHAKRLPERRKDCVSTGDAVEVDEELDILSFGFSFGKKLKLFPQP